jgi:hypothetical protein
LSQAIRTLRRTLGDDSREPRFIRTVSRHGYRFVFADVIEEEDEGRWSSMTTAVPEKVTVQTADPDPYEPLLVRLTSVARGANDEEEQREAAELLHSLGTSEAIRRLGTRPRHAFARALLRDTRWDSPHSEPVPVLRGPAPVGVARALIALRLRRAARMVALRWAGASVGGGLAGIVAGAVGGLILAAAPGSAAPLAIAPVLAVVGGACGAIGGAGVGAGLSVAEASARSRPTIALACSAALGGAVVGSIVQWIGRWSLAALVGLRVPIGGSLEGLVIGFAAGLGYAMATSGAEGGLAAPRGTRRLQVVIATAVSCGVGALLLTLAGHPLVGGTLHAIGRAAHGSQVTLAPLGRLIGEPDFGPVSQTVLGVGEGAMFGFGLALGLTRRPST